VCSVAGATTTSCATAMDAMPRGAPIRYRKQNVRQSPHVPEGCQRNTGRCCHRRAGAKDHQRTLTLREPQSPIEAVSAPPRIEHTMGRCPYQ
jgi:hypothetical protein